MTQVLWEPLRVPDEPFAERHRIVPTDVVDRVILSLFPARLPRPKTGRFDQHAGGIVAPTWLAVALGLGLVIRRMVELEEGLQTDPLDFRLGPGRGGRG